MTVRPAAREGRAPAWLQLLRPPNVATAFADVLAGYATTGLPVERPLAWLLASTICLYAGGVVLNDVFDRQIDATERPERPIPSGRISASAAGILGALLLAVGVLLAVGAGRVPALVALATATSVLLYDAWSKHHQILGPVNMGTCRALNLTLGMAASAPALTLHWPLGFIPLCYIAGVTLASRGEVHGGGQTQARIAFALVAGTLAALGTLALTSTGTLNLAGALVLWGVLAWRLLPAFGALLGTAPPDAIRAAVRTGVLSLVVVDAVIATAYADIIYGLAVVALGLVAVRLARLFAVT
jgi:4-hydroxybenzoate polyprenyltransferase